MLFDLHSVKVIVKKLEAGYHKYQHAMKVMNITYYSNKNIMSFTLY